MQAPSRHLLGAFALTGVTRRGAYPLRYPADLCRSMEPAALLLRTDPPTV